MTGGVRRLSPFLPPSEAHVQPAAPAAEEAQAAEGLGARLGLLKEQFGVGRWLHLRARGSWRQASPGLLSDV